MGKLSGAVVTCRYHYHCPSMAEALKCRISAPHGHRQHQRGVPRYLLTTTLIRPSWHCCHTLPLYSPSSNHFLPCTSHLVPSHMPPRKNIPTTRFGAQEFQRLYLAYNHYLPSPLPKDISLPCVIYCHGNSGCKVDANKAVVTLLPSNINVFALDFLRSGLSDGDHVTLGWDEKDDLKMAVLYLRSNKQVSRIGL